MQQTSDPVGEPIPPPSTVSHNQLKQALVGASTHRLKSSTGRIDQSGAHLFGGIGINGRVIEVMSRAGQTLPETPASIIH